ncbi:glycosyltransferase [Ferruginibacter yonginensis]|uniref:Glycosyltransferase n=1 Tax=Ferruginibacter yonginensis TaxID=1310416 RepID=A0ABV8QS72_9BACT
MKIAHLIYTEGVAGAEKHLKHLLPQLKLHDINCELIIVCPSFCYETLQNFATALQQKNIPVSIIVAGRSIQLNTLKQINAYLRKNGISILHSHLLRSDLLASLVKLIFYKNLYVISSKHGYNEAVQMAYSRGDKKLKKGIIFYITLFTLKYINKNIAVSGFIANLFFDIGLTKEHFHVIYHGLDLPLQNNVHKLNKDYNAIPPKIVVVGRLETIKGHSYALLVLHEIQKVYPNVQLEIVGIGSIKNELEEQVKMLGLEKNVSFIGFQQNPYQFIAGADIILNPTLGEAFGLVFIEAMGLKTPIIAFDLPAGNEIITNNKTGILVPKANVSEMAKSALHLLQHHDVRNNIAQQAYNAYNTLYTTAIMAANTANFYKTAL